jgi:hypothetical protein
VRRLSPSSTDQNFTDVRWLRNRYLGGVLVALLLCTNAFAETTADVTEKSAGATHACSRTDGSCGADPRTDIWSDSGSDDDVVYWDQHGHISSQYGNGTYDTDFNITNDISEFMTEDQMLQGFTMDSAVGLRDRNYVGGDSFRIQIQVTDGTTTYSDTADFTTSAGSSYETVTSQLIVPENTLSYSLATFGLILSGDSLTSGYNGPQTNSIGLTATYEIINQVEDTVLDLVANAVNDILTDTGLSAIDTATMEIDISTPSGTESISVGVTVTPTAVTLAVPTVAGTIEKITINTGMASSDSQPEQVAEVAEAVAEVESAMEEKQEAESESEEKEDSKETKVAKAKAVQAIVNRVLQAVDMAGGDTDGTKLALMGMLGNQGFRSYQRQEIPDVAFYDTTVGYESPTYNDPLGGIFNLGSDQMMDAMTDAQYE